MKKATGFNAATGTTGEGYSRGTEKFAGNHSGLKAVTNAGRGPTVGNKSDKDSTYPSAAAMPAFKTGKEITMGSHNPQVRNPGGTKSVPTFGNSDKINVGRGPTKGNK